MRLFRRNVLATYGVYAASLVSGLVVTPIVVHQLGKTEYGLWAFIGAAIVYLGLLDLGVGPSVVRFAAAYRGSRSEEETSALASVGLVVYGAIGLATAVLGVGLAWLVPVVFDLPDDLVWPARLATLILVVGVAARFPLGLFGSLLAGQQRNDVVNLGNLVSIVLYATLVAAVLTQGGGIVLLASLSVAATLVRLAFPVLWVRRELPYLRLRRALVTRERLRELLGFSSHNFLINVAAKVVFSADVIVVGVFLGAEAAALYAVPAKLYTIAFGAGVAGTNLLYPALAELEGAAELERQRAYLRTGLRAGMALILLIGLPLVLIPDQLIGAWIGGGFGQSTWVMALLGIALVAQQQANVLGQFLIARGRQRALAVVLLVTVAANLVLSIVLAKTVGLWGVALATLATEVVAAAIFIPRLAAEASGLSPRELARASLRPVLPALALALVVLVGVARAYEPDTLLELVPLGALWIVAFVPLAWRFGLSEEERHAAARQLRPSPERHGGAEVRRGPPERLPVAAGEGAGEP